MKKIEKNGVQRHVRDETELKIFKKAGWTVIDNEMSNAPLEQEESESKQRRNKTATPKTGDE